jgi:hypothetical protein
MQELPALGKFHRLFSSLHFAWRNSKSLIACSCGRIGTTFPIEYDNVVLSDRKWADTAVHEPE